MSEPPREAESTPENLEKQLDGAASRVLRQLRDDLYEALFVEAKRLSGTHPITDDDVYLAYKRLAYPSRDSIRFADAQAVISQALRENRAVEWISYGMAVVLFFFGLVLLGFGIIEGEVAVRMGAFFGGSIVELLILIPFRFAINSRRHNIAIRMLGIILDRVDDPKKVAVLLKDTFLAVILGKPAIKKME